MTSLKVYIQRMCQVKPVQGLNISQRQWGAMVPRVRERLQATAIKVYHQIEQKREGTHAAALHPLVEGEKRIMFVYTHAAALHPYGRNTF